MPPTKQRILCIDNHPSSNLAVLLLEQAGYEVVTASSMTDGLKLAKSAQFDLYLLNHHLQDGLEVELCNRLSEFDPDTPVLFYSSVTYPYHQRQAMHCGIEGKLQEPTDISELVKAVSRSINHQARPAGFAHRVLSQVKDKGLSTRSKVVAGAAIGVALMLIGALIQHRHV